MPVKIVISGSRYWYASAPIRARLLKESRNTLIITGGARGVDTIAHNLAELLGFPTLVIKAKWAQFGKAAGYLRNREMLDHKPHLVIGFHADLDRSKGTKDCLTEAKRRGIKTELITG